MAQERYIITQIEKLDGGGEAVFTYSDTFDPNKFKEIVKDSEAPTTIRQSCARRLLNAEVITSDELGEMVRKNSH